MYNQMGTGKIGRKPTSMKWRKNLKRKRALYNIRRTIAFFGYDLRHWTDEELEQEVQRLNVIIKETGFTIEEVIKAQGTLTKVIDVKNKRSIL